MRVLLAIITLFALTSGAAASTLIGWADLPDAAAQNYDDPFLALTEDQIDVLRDIVKTGDRLKAATLDAAARTTLEDRLEEKRAALAQEGIDADWLISQRWIVADLRERAATSGNPAVDGEVVRLAGFAIPAPPAEDGTSVVYLVPERGMCSHTPPPHANQMVRVRIMGDWTPSAMHEPVRLTGRLSITPSKHSFNIVDGLVPMNATFLMEADGVETVADMRTSQGNAAAVNEWAAGIADKLRAAGQLPSAPTGATK